MNGDASVRCIEPARVAGGFGPRVLAVCRDMVSDDRDIAAFALIGVYSDGTTFSGGAADFSELPLNRHLFIGMATELIRDDMLTWETARDVVNRANGFVD